MVIKVQPSTSTNDISLNLLWIHQIFGRLFSKQKNTSRPAASKHTCTSRSTFHLGSKCNDFCLLLLLAKLCHSHIKKESVYRPSTQILCARRPLLQHPSELARMVPNTCDHFHFGTATSLILRTKLDLEVRYDRKVQCSAVN